MQRTVFTFFALIVLGLLFGYAGYLDEQSRLADELSALRHEKAVLQAYEEGRQAGNAEMVDSAQAAWQAAQAEAGLCRMRGTR
jgi:hypothetical protein